MSRRDFRSEAEFHEAAEKAAEDFNRRYGVDKIGYWTDGLLDRALSDHGMPLLDSLPDTPQGIMRSERNAHEHSRKWQRVNASHLLGHVIVHAGERCDACKDWGT